MALTKILKYLILIIPCGLLLGAANGQIYPHPFQNPDLPIEKRIDNLLSLMTREEKVKCLGTVPDIVRLGVQGSGHVEGLHGLSMGDVGGWGGGYPVTTTQFQQEIGLGETWDPDLVRRVGDAEGAEVRYLWESPRYHRGGLVVRAPNADLGRDPRWGRTEECFGEDAFFNGTMAVAMTRGLQGDGLAGRQKHYLQCASLLKHFLSNSNENGREHSSSDYDERLFREYYSVPFRMAMVEGHAQGVMAAYNAVNGVPCTVNPFLKEVVTKEWGHDGIICTDGGALTLLVTKHKRYTDMAQAAADCVKAGINQFLDRQEKPVRTALYKGLLTDAQVDDALRGVFRVMIRLGQLDPPRLVPYKNVGSQGEPWNGTEHKALAKLAAQESVVLLKNTDGFLPLNPAGLKSVAVIGRYADQVVADWYGGDPPYKISPLEGLRARLGPGVRVEFARGDKRREAVKLAGSCDVVLLCLGNHPLGNGGWDERDSTAEGKEGMDRDSMELRQEDLAKAVLEANTRTVVALITSFPVTCEWTAQHAPAILHITHSSQEQGSALAAALFGDINPAGRLVQTWPKSMDQLPKIMDYNIRHGRTYMYFKGEPLYPFGYGLSYTRFAYSDLTFSASGIQGSGSVKIGLRLSNTGSRAGAEVAQLYVRHLDSKVERALKELKGFRRITLAPGESKWLNFELKASDLAYWDEKVHGWKVESDKIEVMVGASSADIRLRGQLDVRD